MKDLHRGYRDLKVYKLAYRLAMDIFKISKSFPQEERYSLTDQTRKSSRSVAANIAEAWKRRRYPKMFTNKTIDSASEAGETEVWLDFSKDCGTWTARNTTSLCKVMTRSIGCFSEW